LFVASRDPKSELISDGQNLVLRISVNTAVLPERKPPVTCFEFDKRKLLCDLRFGEGAQGMAITLLLTREIFSF